MKMMMKIVGLTLFIEGSRVLAYITQNLGTSGTNGWLILLSKSIVYAMPYGRKSRNYKRRHSARRRFARKTTRRVFKKYGGGRRRTNKSLAVRPKWLNPISQSKLIKFVYTDTGFTRTLNMGNGYNSYYVFSGNSPYDPDNTGVGVQPYGWDQYMNANLYTAYNCFASSIKVYFYMEPTYSSIRRLHCLLFPLRFNSPTTTDIADVRMVPFVKETTYDGVTESTRGCKIGHYLPIKRMYPEVSTMDTQFNAAYTASPGNRFYWILLFYTTDYDDEEVDVYFDVKIKYYARGTRATDLPNES